MAPPIVQDVLRSSGQPLTVKSRALFEPRFGHDFSKVRVHTDARASQSARSVDALAYTVGQQIVFRAGQYQPDTTSGHRLLAHELTHVVQQGGEAPVGHPLRVGPSADSHEQAAEATSALMNGTRFSSLRRCSRTPALLQRAYSPNDIGRLGDRFPFPVNAAEFRPGEKVLAGAFADAPRTGAPMDGTGAPARPFPPAPLGILRRKCACEGSASPVGDCQENTTGKTRFQPRQEGGTDPAKAQPGGVLRFAPHVRIERPMRDLKLSMLSDRGETNPGAYAKDGVIALAQAGEGTQANASNATGSAPGCKFTITYTTRQLECPEGSCGAGVLVTPTGICGSGPNCPPLAGLSLTEDVKNDHGCVPGNFDTGDGCTIHADPSQPATCGKFGAFCSDRIMLCMNPDSVHGQCIEKLHQVIGIGGMIAEEHNITFALSKPNSHCTGSVRRT